MSVNTASTPDGRGVLIYNGEMLVLLTFFANYINAAVLKNYLEIQRRINWSFVPAAWLRYTILALFCMRKIFLAENYPSQK